MATVIYVGPVPANGFVTVDAVTEGPIQSDHPYTVTAELAAALVASGDWAEAQPSTQPARKAAKAQPAEET